MNNRRYSPTGVRINWPFDSMAVGAHISYAPEFNELGTTRLAELLSKAKTWHRKRGTILDIAPLENGGFSVKVLSRTTPPAQPKEKKPAQPKTKPKKARAKQTKSNGTQASKEARGVRGGRENSRRHFWREAFLIAMSKANLSELHACSICADEALLLYDKALKDSTSVLNNGPTAEELLHTEAESQGAATQH